MALNSGETAAVWFLIRKIKAYIADGKVSRGKMEAFGDSGFLGGGRRRPPSPVSLVKKLVRLFLVDGRVYKSRSRHPEL